MTKTHISLKQAFSYWLRLGFISFGGPAGQIAIMHQELVVEKRWISEARFLHALNFCMLLPGPEAQQLAIYIGWLMHNTIGGLIAGLLFILPSFFILAGLGVVYMQYGDLPLIQSVFSGIKPAVVAIVLFAAYRIGTRTLKHPLFIAIAALSFIGILFFKLPFPFIVLLAAIIGWVASHYLPLAFKAASHKADTKTEHLPAIIDDDTPIPEHAKYKLNRLLKTLTLGLMIGGLAFYLLVSAFGFEDLLSQTALFFTKAALLTFGGAYAVLPYVYQGAVEHYHWITATQMMDGLALGETTPGPLIMVITFISFVSGWVNHALPDSPLWVSGIATACVATFFTFLPSFMMIFLGAPFIETTRSQLKLAAPLTAITGAVVGVILNLAVFFALHTFWQEKTQQLNIAGLIIASLAFIALTKFKANTLVVIIASGLAGLALGVLN
ncbi:MAG: chromate efflux transporter [Burkholderiaceae bacterium]|nr:chromate efflux transporter [Burkholderiaceae bacterium]